MFLLVTPQLFTDTLVTENTLSKYIAILQLTEIYSPQIAAWSAMPESLLSVIPDICLFAIKQGVLQQISHVSATYTVKKIKLMKLSLRNNLKVENHLA